MNQNGSRPVLADEILRLAGPRRVDRLRRALRTGEIESSAIPAEIEAWIRLFRRDAQPPLRVLVLEVLDGQPDARVTDLLHEALEDRGDSVRLEALRQLLRREHEDAPTLALGLLEDAAMEIRVLAAQSVYATHRERALDALLGAVRAEARGPREMHTLRWVLEFLAEDVVDRAAADAIATLREECEDEEEMIDWALAKLRAGGTPP